MNNLKLAVFPLLILWMGSPAPSASKEIGPIVFDLPELQQVLTKKVGPRRLGPGATLFLEEVTEDGGTLALVIQLTSGWLDAESLPIDICTIIVAQFGEKQRHASHVKGGVWLRNLLKHDKEYRLAYYDARIPVPNDLDVFYNEPTAYQMLLNPTLGLIGTATCFIVLDGNKELMICTESNQEDYGENSPVKRSETFAKLYEVIKEILSSDLDTVVEILEIEGE